jgi:hypothetical protein
MSRTIAVCIAMGAALLAAGVSADDAPCAGDIRRFCEGKPPIDVLKCLQAKLGDLTPACKDRIDRALANAQDASRDCEPDAFAFCREMGPGEPMVTCLAKQQGQLTRRCQAVFDDFARREAANAKVCGDDARRFCPNAKPGKGDVHLCLLFKGSELSPPCRTALSR